MNKKGFTLIEIIGAIIILGIIALIAFNAYTSSMKGFREDYYVDLNRTLKESAKEFFNDNRKYRPNGILEAQKVTVNGLISEKYIDPVVDYNGDSCDLNNSYAIVIKEGKDKYTYHSCLICSEDEYDNTTDPYCDPSWTDPTRIRYGLGGETVDTIYIYIGTNRQELKDLLELEISYERLNYQDEVIASAKGDGKDSLPTVFPIDMDVVDTNKVGTYTVTYEYSPLKLDGTTASKQTAKRNVVVYEAVAPGINITYENKVAKTEFNLASFEGTNKTTSATSLKTETGIYTTGMWAQRITVSINGNAIEIPDPDVKISRYQWNKDGIWQDFCVTENNCTKEILTDMNEEIKFRMVASNGKISKETNPITIRRDYSPPQCELKLSGTIGDGIESNWYVTDVGIEFLSKTEPTGGKEEAKSGIKVNNIYIESAKIDRENSNTSNSHNVDGTGITYVGYVEDNAGNFGTCRQTFKRDATAPTCTNGGDSTTYIRSPRVISYGCEDNLSMCDPNRKGGTNTYSTTTVKTNIAAYVIADKAGNTTNCPVREANVYVDTTPPKCGTITTRADTSTTHGVKANIACSDDNSGCSFNPFITDEIKAVGQYTFVISDIVGNTKTCSYEVCTQEQQSNASAKTCTNAACCGEHDCNPHSCSCTTTPSTSGCFHYTSSCQAACSGQCSQEEAFCSVCVSKKTTCSTCYDKCASTCTSGCCGYNWSDWFDVNSCSAQTNVRQCQTVFRAGTSCNAPQYNVFTAVFHGNGGAPSNPNDSLSVSCSAPVGGSCKIKLPNNIFILNGGTFKGWSTNENASPTDSSVKPVNTEITLSSDVDYHAIWAVGKVTYLATFNANGGTGTTNTVKCTAIISPDGNTRCTIVLPTNGFSKTGYAFNGWLNSSENLNVGQEFVLSSNTEFLADWTPNQYTVTFNVNGGNAWTSSTCRSPSTFTSSGSKCTLKVVYNDTYGSLPTPTRDGHSFTGWYTAASGGTQITNTTTISITSNQTLYAQWKQENITLIPNSFCGNRPGCNTSEGSGTCIYGSIGGGNTIHKYNTSYTCPATRAHPTTGVVQNLISVGGCGYANVTTTSTNLAPGCYKIVYNGKDLPYGMHFIRNGKGEQCTTKAVMNSNKTQYYFYGPVPSAGSYYFGIRARAAGGCSMGGYSSRLDNVQVIRVGDANHESCKGSIYNYYCDTMTGTCDDYCNEYK